VDAIPALADAELLIGEDTGAWDVQATGDGGFVVAGYTRASAAFGSRFADAYLAKMDGDFNVQWARTFEGNENNHALSARPAGDGGYVMLGIGRGDIILGRYLLGNHNMTIVKVNASGETVWSRIVQEDRNTVGFSLCVNDDGSFAVAGATGNGCDACDYDAMLLVKFGADGSELWRRRYAPGEANDAQSLVSATGGGYALAGFTDGHVYVARVDSDGNELWQFSPDETSEFGDLFRGNAIIETRDGGFAVACRVFGGNDSAVLKLDANGVPAWRTLMPGEAIVWGYDLAEMQDGSIVFTGESSQYPPSLDRRACARCYAARISEGGVVQWSALLGRDKVSSAFGVTIASDGNAVLAGYKQRDSSEDLESLALYILSTDLGAAEGESKR